MRGKPPIKIIAATLVVLVAVGWLAYTGVHTKSYYVITQLNAMGKDAYSRNLRVAGNVALALSSAGMDLKPC